MSDYWVEIAGCLILTALLIISRIYHDGKFDLRLIVSGVVMYWFGLLLTVLSLVALFSRHLATLLTY